ncbi:MAG: mechanosensitive ion channel family protein [Nitrososphaerales archaeon]
MSEDASKQRAMRNDFILSVVIVIIAALVAYVAHYYSKNVRMIPSEYVNPIYAIIIIIGGYLLTRIITTIITRAVDPRFGRTRGQGVKNFFQIVAAILALVAIFGLFGFNVTSWLVGAGFIGIVLGLAAQQVLGNIFAGVSLLASRPFEIGDRVTLSSSGYGIIAASYPHENLANGFTGIVQDVGIFYTKMFLDEGVPLVLPNSVVIASLAFNHSKVKTRTVRVRMDLDKNMQFNDFKEQLSALIKSRPNELIETSSLHVDLIDVALQTYQVVIWVWTRSVLEEPVKTILIQFALEIQKKLSQK